MGHSATPAGATSSICSTSTWIACCTTFASPPACPLMYATTGDERLKAKAEAVVAELAKIQQAMPARGFHAGYLSAFPEEFFDRVDARQRVWAPYYTLHKILAGLLDVYLLCDEQQALDVLVKLADWVK